MPATHSARAPRRLLATLAASLLAAAPALARADTLIDALKLAYDTNPDLKAQRSTLAAISEGHAQALAQFGPQVSANGDVQYQDASVNYPKSLFNNVTGSQRYSVTNPGADLSVTQPLYTSGRNRAQLAESSDNILAAQEQVRLAEARLILEVITAYMDVVRDRQSLTATQSEVADLTSITHEIAERGRLGEMDATDVAESDSRLLAAKAQLARAQGSLAASEAEYLAVVGQSPGDLQPPPDLPGVPQAVDQVLDSALGENAQLKAAIDAELAAREEVKIAKAATGPTVTLKVDAQIEPYAAYIPNEFDRAIIGEISVAQPIFTSGLNESRVRQAADRDTTAQLVVDGLRRDITREASQAWQQLAVARATLDDVTKQVQSEQVAFKGNRIEQEAGLRSTIDLLNSVAELSGTELSRLQAVHDEYIARAAVLSVMGRLEMKALALPDGPEADARPPAGG